MDFLTSLGILGETISRNQSYSDIGAIREELKKLNSIAQNNTQKKSNSSSEEFEELTYILRKMAEAQGIKLETREELRQKKEEEERIRREEEEREIDRLVEERRARRKREEAEQARNCPNYSEWYDEPEDEKKKPFLIIGIVAIIIAVTCAIFNGIDTAFSVSERRTAEEIIIPADTSVHKIEVVKPVTPVKSKVVAKKNKNKTAKNVTLDGGSTEEIIVEEKPEVIPADKIFDVVEEMPIFPGGSSALFEYISKNQHYPVVAEENGVQGRVVVTFVVECDGSITNVKVVKSADPSLDYEARRVVSSMPHWIPAKQNGTAVRCKYTVPVTFRLT